MSCPECANVIIYMNEVHNPYFCNRCHAWLTISIAVVQPGDPELIKNTRNWLSEGKPTK